MEQMKPEKASRGWPGLLGFSLLAAAFYRFGHTSIFLASGSMYAALPGMGLAVTQWALILAGLTAAGMAGRLRLRGNRTGVFLLILALALGASYGIFGDPVMRLLNLPVLAVLTVQSLYALTGQTERPPLSGAGLWEGFLQFWQELFSHFEVPMKAWRAREGGKISRGVWKGLLICVPVALAAILLLSSADSVFGSLFLRMLDRATPSSVDGAFSFLWRLLTALVLGMMLFSFLYSLSLSPRGVTIPPGREAQPAVFLMPLGCLAVLYAVFAYIQVRYLFAGQEAADMLGGYAVYARSGFFQLTAVALLSLGLVLPALGKCGKNKAVRMTGAAVLLLVFVILLSAFFRMRLYILVYGLSLLRLLTLWAMGMILAALILALVKCFRPDTRIFPILAAILLAGWVALNYVNVDGVIARYNVRAYNAGAIAGLDTDYLIEELSPDVIPALTEIEGLAEEEREALWESAKEAWALTPPAAYNWSLSQWKTRLLP